MRWATSVGDGVLREPRIAVVGEAGGDAVEQADRFSDYWRPVLLHPVRNPG